MGIIITEVIIMTFQEWLIKNVPCWYLLTFEQEEQKFEEWVDWKRNQNEGNSYDLQ